MNRFVLAATASLFALSAAPAWAQDAEDEARDGDIVVTATRSETLLSKTPLAITAVTGDSLRDAGIVSTTNLGDVVPNLSIDRANGIQVTIRGISSTDATEKGDPSAAALVDGIYLARPQMLDIGLFDLERVEVLRGPQGTLYGRNTTAGVINFITKRPKIGEFGAGVNLGYGNYDAINADGYINIPAGEKMAFRLSASYDQRDNYLSLQPTDPASIDPFRKNLAFRGQAYFEPSDNIDLLIRGTYGTLKGSNWNGVSVNNFYGGVGPSGPLWVAGSSTNRQLLTVGKTFTPVNSAPLGGGGEGSNRPSAIDNSTWFVDGELNWDFGPLKLSYLGSYGKYQRNENQQVALFALAFLPSAVTAVFNGDYKQVSQELRFATTGDGPLKAQFGGYYFREESDIAFYILNSAFGGFSASGAPWPVFGFPQGPTINRTWGVFGQATYEIAPSIRLTAGLRYTDDYKYRYGHTVRQFRIGDPIVLTPIGSTINRDYVNDAQVKANKLTWRVGFDADVAGGLLYGSVATGYKAGGFGDGCSTGLTTRRSSQGERCDGVTPTSVPGAVGPIDPQAIYYSPETVTAYELGFRGKIAKGVKIDITGFYYDYTNQQLSSVLNVGGSPSLVTQNSGSSSVKGIEFETTLQPNANNQIRLGLDWLDASYKEFCPGGTTTGKIGDPCAAGTVDFSGRKLDRSPTISARASYTLTIPVGEGSIVANIGTRLASKRFVTVFGAAPTQYVTPSHTKTDISLTYNAPNDRFYVSAYGRNLENFITVNNVSGAPFFNVGPGDPRTYGIRAGFKF